MIGHSLRIWAQFRRFCSLNGFSLSSPISHNHFFKPSLDDPTFNIWYQKGIRCFGDLFFDNNFASFHQLSVKFDLPNSHFFRYLQVRHFIRSSIPNFPVMPNATVVDSLLHLNPTDKGLISNIYGKIKNLKQMSTGKIKNLWEQDLNISISNDLWDSILKLVNSTSLCARHSLLQCKVVHRVHMSKLKLSRIYSEISPNCDKCKGGIASLIHMFWFCPALQNYWKDVFSTLSSILNYDLKPNPLIALFGTSNEVELYLNPTKRRTLSFAVLLARRAILLKWKGDDPPSHAQWLRDIMSCLDLEKIHYSVLNIDIKFQRVWGPFLDYFNNS